MRSRDRTGKPFRPLASRLVTAVIAVCAGCAVLATLILTGQAWQDSMLVRKHTMQEISDSRMSMLTSALWDIDGPTIQRLVDDIARHPQVSGVHLSTAGGQHFLAGVPIATDKPSLEMPVPHPHSGGAPLGLLAVAFNSAYETHQLLGALLRTAGGVALFSALACVLLVRLLRRELTEPLQQIAAYTRRLRLDTLAVPLKLTRRRRGWKDDIDLVAEAFGTLHTSIVQYVAERDVALHKLSVERDQLDSTVRERTADIVRMNDFLARLAQLSADLINVPLEQYPDSLRGALADIANGMGARAGALAERDAHGRWVWRLTGGTAPELVPEGWELPQLPLPLPSSFAPLASGHAELPGTAELDEASFALSRASGMKCLVLGYQDECPESGHLIACFGLAPNTMQPRREEIDLIAEVVFSAFLRWKSLAELEETRQKLLAQSRTDALTGLANRREFDERKHDELRRACRAGQALSVMMVDIDHFKRFNDTYGHAAGDECLVRIGNCLHSLFLRSSECVARIGGEEFAVLIPSFDSEHAQAQARRFLEALAHLDIAHSGSSTGRVSASVGLATMDTSHGQPSEGLFDRLLETADRALYEAKARGRNMVVARVLDDAKDAGDRAEPRVH